MIKLGFNSSEECDKRKVNKEWERQYIYMTAAFSMIEVEEEACNV